MKPISLNFATNMFGKLKPEIIERLEKVIENPCQETWEDTYCIVLNSKGRMCTLWNAVLYVDPSFIRGKKHDAPWDKIPTKETIKEAINYAVFEYNNYSTKN